MPEIGSNQYPRLPWEHNPEPVFKGYIARPHGSAASARVYFAVQHATFAQWVWVVCWPDRFSQRGFEPDKQAAANAATIAYWDQMEATEGWKPPVVPDQPVDLMVHCFWQRVRRWVLELASLDEIDAQHTRYRLAATKLRPPIMGPELDREMWRRLTDLRLERRFPRYRGI